MRGDLRFLGVIALFSLIAVGAAYPDIKVLVAAAGSPEDPGMSTVLSRATLLAVQSEGLTGILYSGTAANSAETSSLLSAAKTEGASFLLVLRYLISGDHITLETSLLETASGSTLIVRTTAYSLDLNLDTNVTGDARLVFVDPRVEAAMRRARELAAAQPSPRSPVQKGSGGQAAGRTPAEAGAAQKQPAPGKPVWGLALSGEAAPLILIANGSSFFRYGAVGSVFGGARYALHGMTLRGGLHLGVTRLFPVSGLPAAKVYTVLGGLEIGAATSADSLVGVGLNVTGGAAVIALQMPGASVLAKTVPFAEGGLSAYLHVAKVLAIGVDVAFLAVFEGSYPLMGVAPALVVGTGF